MRKFFTKVSRRNNAIFLGKQNAKILQQIWRKIINYDLRKLLILNSQSRELHKFLWALYCCISYKPYGFHGNFFREIISCEISRKFVSRNRSENFCILKKSLCCYTLVPIKHCNRNWDTCSAVCSVHCNNVHWPIHKLIDFNAFCFMNTLNS